MRTLTLILFLLAACSNAEPKGQGVLIPALDTGIAGISGNANVVDGASNAADVGAGKLKSTDANVEASPDADENALTDAPAAAQTAFVADGGKDATTDATASADATGSQDKDAGKPVQIDAGSDASKDASVDAYVDASLSWGCEYSDPGWQHQITGADGNEYLCCDSTFPGADCVRLNDAGALEGSLDAGSDCANCEGYNGVFPYSYTTCEAGQCKFVACPSTRADCNHDLSDGCEADLDSVTSCGSCTNRCVNKGVKTWKCTTDHQCEIVECEWELKEEFVNNVWIEKYIVITTDCDGDPSNGCETNVYDDPNHCGGCYTKCQAGYYCSENACGD